MGITLVVFSIEGKIPEEKKKGLKNKQLAKQPPTLKMLTQNF